MIEASKTHKGLAAAMGQDELKADIQKEIALLLQSRGIDPRPRLEAARIAELEKQSGLPIAAAIERNRMIMGRRSRQDNTIGNYF
jgi:hypothetical protein